jgi:3-hydroxybutyryl-CoA dehydrogenase
MSERERDHRRATPLPAHVGIIGGGRMGAGIAHAFLLAGSRVTIVERDADAAAAATARVRTDVERSAARATGSDADEPMRRLGTGTGTALLADAGLVIEAVPEDRTLKAATLARAEQAAPDAVIASNTSSISIDALAAGLSRPERFLGLHFFNPVPSSLLVEVVAGTATDPRALDDAAAWVTALRKQAIVVRDSPGFASSRLGVALALEAIRMLEEGVAEAADIDAAMELGYRHPLGPLRTTDLVGLDVRLGIAEELAATLGERFAPPQLLRNLVAEGRLGRKTGHGFYEWSGS